MAPSSDAWSMTSSQRGFAGVHALVEVEHQGTAGRRQQHRPAPSVAHIVLARNELKPFQTSDDPRHCRRVDHQIACEHGGRGAPARPGELAEHLELRARDAILQLHARQEQPVREVDLAQQVQIVGAGIVFEQPGVVLGARRLVHKAYDCLGQ